MKIKIDGNEYDFPTLESVTLDEAILLERQAGVTLDELIPGEALPAGAFKGLVMIAIKRIRPDVPEREIAERVGQLKLAELETVVQRDEEAVADPPTPVDGDSSESTASSGANGNTDGAISPAPSLPSATGTRASGTGLGSVHPISAA